MGLNMRIGCAAYSYRKYLTEKSMTLEDFIRIGWELGLDGVELTEYYFPSLEDTYIYKLKKLLLSYGLDISAVAVGNRFTVPDSSLRKKEIERVKRWVNIALKIGAPCVRVFAGRVPKGHTEEDAFQWTIDALKECVEYASKSGIVIALENHGGITSTADQVLKIINAVSSEWFGINLDLGNYRQNTYEDIRKTAPYAVHVHAKFLQVGPKGNDEILDYNKIIEILNDVGYKGYLSIEYEGKEDPKTAVPRAVKFLKTLIKGS